MVLGMAKRVNLNNMNEDTFFVKSDTKYHAVKKSEISWIFSEGNFCTIQTANLEEYTIRISLDKIKDSLNSDAFVQTHRSYIININSIKVYDPLGKVLINQQEIPVSRTYRKAFEEKLFFLR